MVELLVTLLLVALASAVAIQAYRRRAVAAKSASDEAGRAPGMNVGKGLFERPAGLSADDVVLVPLPNHGDEALVLASEQALSVLDASGLTRRATTRTPGPLPQLVRSAMTAGGIDATRSAQHGIESGRIVALSQETMEHLDKGKPVYDKTKNMLGIVKGDKGKISHVMRLDQKGAQAVVASNAATLAVTAALSQQLESIAEQLADISATLEGMVRDKDRERLAEVIAANEILLGISDNVRRRGITQTDANQLAALRLPVTAKQFEAEFKFDEVLGDELETLTRGDRLERLKEIAEKERLDYWLAVRVQTELARTRVDLLNLYWEHHAHPDTAGVLNESVHEAIRSRQSRLQAVGEALRELSDPEARTRLDPMRQLSRYRLGKEHAKIDELLAKHGTAFAGPDGDPFSLIEGVVRTEKPALPPPD